MEPNKTLFEVNKTESFKTKVILSNILKMLSKRIYVDDKGILHSLIQPDVPVTAFTDKGDGSYTITTDNNKIYVVKIVFQKITTTGKQSVISEFLKDYSDYNKIIVVRDYINKISKYVAKHNTQIFREDDFLEDILAYSEQPQFELLSPKEVEKFKSEYNATDFTIKNYLRSDPIVRYFALKPGDMVRIIRPSGTSGESVDYRIVT